MSNSSDPERGGQQPEDRSPEGQPDGGAAAPQPGQSAPYGQPGQYQPPQYPSGQYQPGQYPQTGSYGQPGQQYPPGQYGGPYGQPGQPGQYDVPTHGQPYGDRGGYVYSPYGSSPAGTADEPAQVRRPGSMAVALVLLILSAVPFLAFVLFPLMLPSDVGGLPPDIAAQVERELANSDLTYAQLVTGAGVLSVVFAAVALAYVVFAVLAFRGHAWARVVVTIMTVGFTLLLLLGVLSSPPGVVLLVLPVIAAAVIGTVLLYSPAAARYIGNRRR